ncbi:NAD-dependent epimerase/dehydratase family protein [Streptomyces sp. SID8352]|uniref:NAD-dependent epimerase/dehydratase family protein n=1 Tax=Streptomyces sp. SID8352 TaxID=2690338 RepID=UPI00136FF88F|nr:NAD-dependent epimerase/dehydratase family protein [Streptomyces sp. SID8352]MYU23640.1 NAD-dependent epimerase/dehydratase family protein [Streptomyces sp. SID8352]
MSVLRLLDRENASELPDVWLVTGVAGFIGSHLLETLLEADRQVVGLDNFSTGKKENLADVAARVGPDRWGRFRLIEGDLRSRGDCDAAVHGVDIVLHQAALNSVPRSMAQPVAVLETNSLGSVNLFTAAAEAGVSHVVYASSSSVYGDVSAPMRRESVLGEPMSPYAVSKRAMEQLAAVVHRNTATTLTGLRYFNVFGPRQNPDGPYSAVIPRWIRALLATESPVIYGDGTQSRDFTHVDNVVRANILAAVRTPGDHQVFNVGTGHGTSLNTLFEVLRAQVAAVTERPEIAALPSAPAPPRAGDVLSALAELSLVRQELDYEPTVGLVQGLRATVSHFAGTPTTHSPEARI